MKRPNGTNATGRDFSDNTVATALRAAADAANCDDPRVLKAVLQARPTTAKALAQTAPQGIAPAHRRGGRPLDSEEEALSPT